MSFAVAILAVALSLDNPADYIYTTPFSGTNQIIGIGMGKNADYTIVRAEDVAFLREAYAERTDVPFAFVPDGTNALDRPIVARPSRVSAAVFEDGDWGGCFSLSYTADVKPYSALSAGSFVRDGFAFDTSIHFAEVPAFPSSAPEEFRTMSSNAVAHGKAFATNEIPSTWYNIPYVVATNRICSLYAGLPLFDVAALNTSYANKTNRTTVYGLQVDSARVSSYVVTTRTNADTGVSYSYNSGYAAFSATSSNSELSVQGPWSAGFSESRRVTRVNEYSCIRDGGAGPWPLLALGNYESMRVSQTLRSVSNSIVWIESPVRTNAQHDIQLIQTVLAVRLTHTVSRSRTWSNPSLSTGSTLRVESTNIVRRAVMFLPLSPSLDTTVGTNWDNSRWLYKAPVPMDYIQTRATALFGDIADHWPGEAQVEDDEIAASGTAGGSAVGETYVTVGTDFGMRTYMVYRRTFKARTL